MSSFKPAFSPAEYDWDVALRLNCLQWVFENGALPFDNVSFPGVHLLQEPCVFKAFPKASGTVLEADIFTLRYLHQPASLLSVIRRDLLSSDECAADMPFTLLDLFVPGMVNTPIIIDPDFRQTVVDQFCAFHNQERALELITAEIAALRVRLCSMCSPPPSSSFQPAFSPAKYGWDDALRLNCLQWALENGTCPFVTQLYNHRMRALREEACCWDVLSRASGSNLEAYFLALGYVLQPSRILSLIRSTVYPSDMPFTLLDLFAPGMVETPVVDPFDSDFRQTVVNQFCVFSKHEHARGLITAETAALCLRLFHRSRAMAFLSGKLPGSESAVSALSDDVCRMILQFAQVE